jgi:ATP-dependent Clp protease ATP-binding subunit ClpB
MLKTSNIEVEITDKAIDWIADEGYDPQFGARPVKRVLQKYILNELSKKILAENVITEKKIIIDRDENGLIFNN